MSESSTSSTEGAATGKSFEAVWCESMGGRGVVHIKGPDDEHRFRNLCKTAITEKNATYGTKTLNDVTCARCLGKHEAAERRDKRDRQKATKEKLLAAES